MNSAKKNWSPRFIREGLLLSIHVASSTLVNSWEKASIRRPSTWRPVFQSARVLMRTAKLYHSACVVEAAYERECAKEEKTEPTIHEVN